jgi:hypothetical protein
MEEKVEEFKDHWAEYKGYISLELEDYQIAEFIERAGGSIEKAVDWAADYLLANGLAEVQE